MKNLKLHIIAFATLISSMFVASCANDDEDTTPSMADVDRMEKLVDTSNSDIVDFKNQYGTYLLYNFDFTLDFVYQFEEATAWSSATVTPLEQKDVADAVKFLKNSVFNCYSDEYKKKFLPRKILLCSKITKKAKLGLSSPGAQGEHQAVANMNSVSIGELNEDDRLWLLEDVTDSTQYVRNIHFTLLAAYLVNARGEFFAPDEFFDYSSTYYNSLMDPDRKAASQLSDEFFYKKGFFRPDSNGDTYFGSAQNDLVQYVENAVKMDKKTSSKIKQYDTMKKKMRLVIEALEQLGVDINEINPLAAECVK